MGAPWPETSAIVRTPPLQSSFKITAKDRAFWSFQPIANPTPPNVQNQAWQKCRSIALFSPN